MAAFVELCYSVPHLLLCSGEIVLVCFPRLHWYPYPLFPWRSLPSFTCLISSEFLTCAWLSPLSFYPCIHTFTLLNLKTPCVKAGVPSFSLVGCFAVFMEPPWQSFSKLRSLQVTRLEMITSSLVMMIPKLHIFSLCHEGKVLIAVCPVCLHLSLNQRFPDRINALMGACSRTHCH